MTDIDFQDLKAWYRDAMRERIRELEALRPSLAQQHTAARSEARNIGRALMGSGGTFGFPEVSEAGRLVEDAPLTDLVRRVEGLLSVLRVVAHPELPPVQQRWAWLAATAKVEEEVLAHAESGQGAWDQVAEAAGLTDEELADAVARRFKLEMAELSDLEERAARLVPPALMREFRMLPLREDGDHIYVATCDPTDLDLEFRLERITGRTVVFRVADPHAIQGRLDESEGTAQPPAEAETRASRGTPVPAAATVLVVDDSAMSRHMARAALERKGYGVIEAVDGVDALERLEGNAKVGLIVVDLQMPRMDGREFVRAFRARPDGEITPIIVLTGAEDPKLEADLIEDGADDYIRKPLDPRLFLARVTATMRRRGA